MRQRTKTITKIGMLTAIGVVLMFLEFPILPGYPFLKLDFSEVPVLLGGFAMGPLAAVVIEVLKNFIHFMVKNDGTGGIGNLANIIVGCALVVPATWYYLKHKSIKGVIIGLAIGLVSMVLVGIVANYYIFLPLYGMVDHEAKVAILFGGITPLNAVKAIAVSIPTYILYKPLSPLLHK